MKKMLKLFVLTIGFSTIAQVANSMHCCTLVPLYGLGFTQEIWCYGCGPGLGDACTCTPMELGTVAYYKYGTLQYWEYTSGSFAKGKCCGFPA
ncbi:hypothetical protein [Runella rosea]|uniref:hypothetical protein n=1 Tax=Runella rosea TaxID=2259595 RepID=UPI0013B3ECDA|nr:hypothetical protein [Runella rosea]